MRFGYLQLALRAIIRRPWRSLALIIAIASLAAVLVVLSALYASVYSSVRAGATRLGADAMVVSAGWGGTPSGILMSARPSAVYLTHEQQRAISSMGSITAASPQLFIISAPLACCSLSNTVLVGFDPQTDFTVSPWLRDNISRPLEADEVVVGSNILAEVGGRIRFFDSVFRIAGKIEPTGMPLMDGSVFIPMNSALRMLEQSPDVKFDIPAGASSALMLRFKQGISHDEAAVKIEYEVPGVTVVLAERALQRARESMSTPINSMALAAIIQWVVSIVLIAVVFGMSFNERRAEAGMMRAMGGRRLDIARAYLVEALIIAIIGAIVGVITGAMAYAPISARLIGTMGMIPISAPSMLLLCITSALVSIASGTGASMLPAISASKVDPAESVRPR